MTAIAATDMTGSGARGLAKTTLSASDTFSYRADRSPVLLLNNVTAGPLTVVIDGGGGTTIPVAGIGNVDVSAGYSTGAIAAGAVYAIPLKSIEKFLKGTIAVTGGAGIVASLLEF